MVSLDQVYPTTDRGFSLIEALVAIAILMTVIVAYMSMARESLQYFTFSKEQVTAYFLAHDAMEYIKAVYADDLWARQTLLLSGSWDASSAFYDQFITASNFCGSANGCYIDTSGLSSVGGDTVVVGGCVAAPTGCPPIYLDGASGGGTYRYNHDGSGSITIFDRVINMSIVNNFTVKVEVIVTWGTAANESVTVVRYFSDIAGQL